ncbi:MAG: arginine--tRNA ligase [Planctomycetales bacterium]|nr:arginine--tRNA ligase [bacterium]UNM07187.1 MAG: arginine--tRNA ligase [Planctomycetales bacterium]
MTESLHNKRRIMVEYAQPNTHKDFHVGHLRNASIGQAIANLLEFQGHGVYKATYIGDVGAHVAKAMWGEIHLSDQQYADQFAEAIAVKDSPDRLLFWGSCYRAGNLLSDDPEVKQQQRAWLKAWEDNPDGEERRSWMQSRNECDEAFRAIFDELLLQFTAEPDLWFYESTVDDTKLGQKTAQELLERGIAEIDDSEEYKGSMFVDFEKQADALKPDGTPVFRDDEKKKIRKLGKMVILRSDGTSLYQTKELGLAKHKFDLIRETTGSELQESLYVVGAEQKLYFQQVLAILRLWGFPNAENCRHIDYELVVLPEGKMSSRAGSIVSYRDLRDEALRRAEETVREKGIITDEAQIRETAQAIAIAAIKYTMLQVSGSQQIVFDFEQALSFSGRSAPYLQYAYARAGKLIEGGPDGPVPDEPGYALDPSELALVRLLSMWPGTARRAAEKYEPAFVCTYLYELASAFSDFYRDCRVLGEPQPQLVFRTALVRAFRQVVSTGFRLLALPLPEAM